MATPFDAPTKQIVEMAPADWVRFLGLPAENAEIIDADLATVTTAADRIIQVYAPLRYLVHLEFESGHEGGKIPERMLRYNVLIQYRHRQPVRSVVLLLHRGANSPEITGVVSHRYEGDDAPYLRFEYEVVRLWELSPDVLLAGPLATLPLVGLTNVSPDALPGVVQVMEKRIAVEAGAESETAKTLWVATFILLGMYYPSEFAAGLLKGVRQLKNSSTYQAIVEEGRVEGRVEEAQAMILRLGTKRFGLPNAQTQTHLAALQNLDVLNRVFDQLLEVENWDELRF